MTKFKDVRLNGTGATYYDYDAGAMMEVLNYFYC
jgi:hypothetical protein